jgi:hypothetical protein
MLPMKTQIITLESHDDLVSIRDRMSWAKSPRILLVLPAREKALLGPLDLRILQQHARGLGAQLGVVAQRRDFRRDARAFGLPTFRSTAEAQSKAWAAPVATRPRRRVAANERLAMLKAMRDGLSTPRSGWISAPAVRIVLFALAVLAVFSIVSLFIPRASVLLVPIAVEQQATLPVTISTSQPSDPMTGVVLSVTFQKLMGGKQSLQISSTASVPQEKSRGVARFENLTQSPMVIPAGTVVHSASAGAVRFATLAERELDAKVGAFVEVPIEALEAGKIGNLPASVIQGIEGRLGAYAAATNPEATTGGSDSIELVPSEADRARLRKKLFDQLASQAAAEFETALGDEGIILTNTLAVSEIEQEVYDPPPGQPGELLSLAVSAIYEVEYVVAEDLERLAEASMNAALPAGFLPKPGTLHLEAAPSEAQTASGGQHLEYEVRRTIMRQVDGFRANQLVRGLAPVGAARALQDQLPLARPPEIHLSPPWWPWPPLIPFRITVTMG